MREDDFVRHAMSGVTVGEQRLMEDFAFDNEIATAILVGMSRIGIAIKDVADGLENSINAVALSISPDNLEKTIYDAMHEIASGVMADVKKLWNSSAPVDLSAFEKVMTDAEAAEFHERRAAEIRASMKQD
jgi:hypothetical protein